MFVIALLLYALCIVYSLVLWLWLGSARRVTPFAMFAGTLFLFLWPATLRAVYQEETVGLTALVLLFASTLSFLLVYLISPRPKSHRAFTPAISGPVTRYRWMLGLLTLATLSLNLWFLGGLPPVLAGIGVLATGGSSTEAVDIAGVLRFELTKSFYFGGSYRGQGVILDVLGTTWPLLAGTAICIWYLTRKRSWFLAAVGISVLALVLFGGIERLRAMLLVLFGITLLSQITAAPLRQSVGGVLIAAVLFFGLSALSGQIGANVRVSDAGTVAVFDRMISGVERLFFGNAVTDLEVIRFVEDGDLRFGYGAIFASKLVLALPGPALIDVEPFSLTMTRVRRSSEGTAFSSMTNMGVLYADFGWFGPVIGFGLVGLLAALVERWQEQASRDPLTLAYGALLTVLFFDLGLGSFVSAASSAFVAYVIVWMMRALLPAFASARAPAPRVAAPPRGAAFVPPARAIRRL